VAHKPHDTDAFKVVTQYEVASLYGNSSFYFHLGPYYNEAFAASRKEISA